jgi:Rrf2 family protein
MKLSTKSRYGTRLILDIAVNGKNGPVRISETAARQKISVKYLERIVQVLKNAGYVRSKRGNKGGHLLAKPIEDITVGEIVRVLEGECFLVDCVGDAAACASAGKCITRRVWLDASNAMFEKLDTIRFSELVGLAHEDSAEIECQGDIRCLRQGSKPADEREA